MDIVKKKTYWYIVLRATREKIRYVANIIKNDNIDLETAKKTVRDAVSKRLDNLFKQELMENDLKKEERREEMMDFAEYVIEIYFKEKGIVKQFINQYPIYYKNFSRVIPTPTDIGDFVTNPNMYTSYNLGKNLKKSIKDKCGRCRKPIRGDFCQACDKVNLVENNKYYKKYLKYKSKYLKYKQKIDKAK